MTFDLAAAVGQYLASRPGERFKAGEIARAIAPESDAKAVRKLTAAIRANWARWRADDPALKATDEKPRRYYREAEVVPAPRVTDALARGRLGMAGLLDRGAVLFIGVGVGLALALSLATGGRQPALFGASAADLPVAPPPPVAARTCTDAFPLSPRVIEGLRNDRPLTIGVFGDSFGEGVWAGTVYHLEGDPAFRTAKFAKQSTGFTRYASLNVFEEARKQIADQPIDIALISFGANDTQGIWAEGSAAPYMSPAWQKVIGGRAKELVEMLRGEGIAVGWVGLPRMRDEEFDRQTQLMNAFYAGLMCDLGVPFVDPTAVSENAGPGFSKEMIDPATGKSFPARANDGIHMSVHGYSVIAAPLLGRIDALAGQGVD